MACIDLAAFIDVMAEIARDFSIMLKWPKRKIWLLSYLIWQKFFEIYEIANMGESVKTAIMTKLI